MAIKDGRCPNCGSILHLDNSAEKGHCLFCDAVFDTSRALEIAADPAGVEFPNLPQPKYEGPDLSPRSNASKSKTSAKAKSQVPAKKPAEPKAPQIVKEPVKMPDFKIDARTRNRILLVILAIIVLTTAIAAPLIMSRENARSQLLEAMPSISPFEVVVEKAVNIGRSDNSYLLIVAQNDITQDAAVRLFRNYAEQRAEVYGMDLSAAIYSPVTVKIVTPEGGWLINRPDDLAAVESGSAVKPLKP